MAAPQVKAAGMWKRWKLGRAPIDLQKVTASLLQIHACCVTLLCLTYGVCAHVYTPNNVSSQSFA